LKINKQAELLQVSFSPRLWYLRDSVDARNKGGVVRGPTEFGWSRGLTSD
jgi:hypothetical protein